MGTIRVGYLHKYATDIVKLQNNKADFKVVSSGLTRKIIFNSKTEDKQKRLYFGHKKSDILPGVHMVNAVRRSIDKYIENPYMLRYYHMRRIANFLNINVRDIIDIIEIDLPEGELIIKGEEGFNLIDAMPSKYRHKELNNENL